MRKSLDIEAGVLTLAMVETAKSAFRATSSITSNALEGIESLPVIPREIQDTLTISTTERHRWLNDGRLPSARTSTVKLRGRARKMPKLAAEDRRRAALKAKLTRSLRSSKKPSTEELNLQLPFRETAGLDRLPKVTAVEIRIRAHVRGR